MIDSQPDGATPIEHEETDDLLAEHIRTRGELNRWEQENIVAAVQWTERTTHDALDDRFIRELHRRMFDRTWDWAGRYRRSDKNLGVEWSSIPMAVREVLSDGRFWLENSTYPLDDAALRLHHRLVQIHPFPNGNGRHARLWCDTILRQNGRPPFIWKSTELDRPGEARRAYIKALQVADAGNYGPLFELILRNRPG